MYWTKNQIPELRSKSGKEFKQLLEQAKRGNRRFSAAYLFLSSILPIAFVSGKIVDTYATDIIIALLMTALIAAPLYYGVYLVMLNWFVVPELRGE